MVASWYSILYNIAYHAEYAWARLDAGLDLTERIAHNLRGLRLEVTTDTVGRFRLMRLLARIEQDDFSR